MVRVTENISITKHELSTEQVSGLAGRLGGSSTEEREWRALEQRSRSSAKNSDTRTTD